VAAKRRRPGRPRNRGRRVTNSHDHAPLVNTIALEERRAPCSEGVLVPAEQIDVTTSASRAETEAVRILETDPRAAPKRRERAMSIVVIALPYDHPVLWCRDDFEFFDELEKGGEIDEDELFKLTKLVIPAARFPELAAAGGLVPLLAEKLGPGRYRCVWISADLHQIDSEEHEIPDLKAAARAREAAAKEKRREELARERETALEAIRAQDARLLDAWASEQAFVFMTHVGQLVSMGAAAEQLHTAVHGWIRAHALEFVDVRRGQQVDKRVFRPIGPGGAPVPVAGKICIVPCEPHVVWKVHPLALTNALRMWVPPRTPRRDE